MITKVFSPFYTILKLDLDDTNLIKENYLSTIQNESTKQATKSPDWNVNTSFGTDHGIDWRPGVEIYKKYVNQFHEEFFEVTPKWLITGEPWYTAYGKNQSANVHDHIPNHFSVVHFLKFDKDKHPKFKFVNPNSQYLRVFAGHNHHFYKYVSSDDSYWQSWHAPDVEEGDFIIFPSNIEHFVDNSKIDDLRITIAFNYKIAP